MKFQFSDSFIINSKIEPWSIEGLRVCFFGGSGSGKSWTAALFIEQWLDQGGTVIIFQPRDEYFTLKEAFDVLCVGGVHAKDLDFIPVKPSAYAKAIVEQGVNIVFYTSDVEEEKLISFVQKLLSYIMKFNERVKRPILIVLEEAQEYCPISTRGRVVAPWIYAKMIKAFKDLFLQGRKLNISTIALSPRPQEVNYTIRQLANLTFYGKFSPQDIGYVDRECLKPYRERGLKVEASKLLDLKVGMWLVIYGANAEFVKVTHPRITSHGAVTPKLKYEAPKKMHTKRTMKQLLDTIQNALKQEEMEKSELEKLKRKIKTLQEIIEGQTKEIERLQTALKVAGSIKLKVETKGREVKHGDITRNIAKNVVNDLRVRVLDVFSSYINSLGVMDIPTEKVNLKEIWMPKLKTRAAKRVLEFLWEHKGMKYTRSELARFLGYASKSGTFSSGISELKRNNLVETDGKYLWVRE